MWQQPRRRGGAADFSAIFGNFGIFGKLGFLAYLGVPGVPGPLKSGSGSKNTPGDLSTSKKKNQFIIFLNFF